MMIMEKIMANKTNLIYLVRERDNHLRHHHLLYILSFSLQFILYFYFSMSSSLWG